MNIARYKFLGISGFSSTLTPFAHTEKLSPFAARLHLDEWLPLPNPNGFDIFVVAEKIQSHATVFAQLQENQIIEKNNTQPDEDVVTGRQAIEYFLRLASGMIVDPLSDDAFEKFQENYALANEAGCLGPVIQHLFQQGVWLHEKARMETDFFKYAVQEQSVLRELAQKIFGSLQNGAIYIAGCPQEAENYLVELQNHGCKKIVALHGQDVMPEDVFPQIQCSLQQVDGNNIRLTDCDALLVFDAKLSKIFAAKKLSQQLAKRNNRPLLVFDWTNNLDMASRHANLYFYNRSDLAKLIEHNQAARGSAVKTIDEWINKEIDGFYTWLASDNRYEFAGIIGSTKSMQHVFELISRIARTNITVLIDGESGTGKELVARAIHRLSARQKEEFVAVNCGAIPENLLESELFGHVRGSFTGAISDKMGLFELAQGGTIFLDEIAELAPHLQVKILRFLQENEIKRVGSNEMIRLDVRVLAATNKNLSQLVNEGAFRSDLFYRLNVLQLTLPALRERRQDIPLLSNHFLEKFSRKFQKNVSAISKEAMDALVAYHWPGNIRELENAIEHATALAIGKSLSPYDLPAAIIKKEKQNGRLHNYGKMSLRELEKNYILETLDEFDWDYEFVCKQLGIGRTTLWRKLKEYKISK